MNSWSMRSYESVLDMGWIQDKSSNGGSSEPLLFRLGIQILWLGRTCCSMIYTCKVSLYSQISWTPPNVGGLHHHYPSFKRNPNQTYNDIWSSSIPELSIKNPPKKFVSPKQKSSSKIQTSCIFSCIFPLETSDSPRRFPHRPIWGGSCLTRRT